MNKIPKYALWLYLKGLGIREKGPVILNKPSINKIF